MATRTGLLAMKQITECIPIVTVSDIAKSMSFYTDTLGFRIDFDAGEVSGLLHGNVLIYLIAESSENKRKPAGSANLCFMVDEVDELYERCCAAGSEVLVKPGDRVYGQRDFAISDRDGNVLVFACGLASQV